MQLPQERIPNQRLIDQAPATDRNLSQSSLKGTETSAHRYNTRVTQYKGSSYYRDHHAEMTGPRHDQGRESPRHDQGRESYSRTWEENRWKSNNRQSKHSDRITRPRDEHGRDNRYGGARFRKGPYDRFPTQTWKEKSKQKESSWRRESRDDTTSQQAVPYEQPNQIVPSTTISSNEPRELSGGRKLASTIVTPLPKDHAMEENVTRRHKGEGRILTFSPSNDQDPALDEDQIIGALADMEMIDQTTTDMMEEDVERDDLLGLDLMEMEADKGMGESKAMGDGAVTKLIKVKKHSGKRAASLEDLQVGVKCYPRHEMLQGISRRQGL
ncbi:Uncharacterized protein Rs2_16257 [Raphanus sativus]|nr:Uncharacterized protein Rs2_16257 [Raphanus sativus]